MNNRETKLLINEAGGVLTKEILHSICVLQTSNTNSVYMFLNKPIHLGSSELVLKHKEESYVRM